MSIRKDPLYDKLRLPKKMFGSPNSIYGIIIWFSIFGVIVPYLLISMFGVSSMIRYLPVIDLIANIMTNAGDEQFHSFFNDVYDVNQNAIVDYFTMNLINVFALSGVVLVLLYEMFINKKSARRGMFIALVMFIVTYLIPTRLIGLTGQWARRWMAEQMGTEVEGRYGWFGMLVATVFTFILIMIEFYIVTYLI